MTEQVDTLNDISYPLTPTQEGMYFHALYDRGATYMERREIVIEGPLDQNHFRKAWQQVVDRHDILRSRFLMNDDDEAVQVVIPEVDILWQYQDCTHLDEAQFEVEVHKQRAKDAISEMNPEATPPLCFHLTRLTDHRHVFVFRYHHIVMDGWSLSLVWQEVMALYGALISDVTSNLPAPIPFRNYVTWLAERDASGDERFWRETLAGFDTPTPIPILDSSGLSSNPVTDNKRGCLLDEKQSADLIHLARQSRVTFNTLVQAAWAVLLQRHSGNRDLVYGLTLAGRPRSLAGFRDIVGLFINTLPLRLKLGQQTLREWLPQVQKAALGLHKHESSSLVEVQGYSDVPRELPLFETILVFENAGGYMSDNHGLSFDLRDAQEKPNYPLALYVRPGERLSLELIFDPDRFEEAVIDGVLDQLSCMLKAFPAHLDQSLDSLPILSDAASQYLLHHFNQTQQDLPKASIVKSFETRVLETPNAPALVLENQTWTYTQLNENANRIARTLMERGAGCETRIGVCMERSLEMLAALWGVLKSGAAYVPFDRDMPPARLAYIRRDANIHLLLTHQNLAASCGLGGSDLVSVESCLSGDALTTNPNRNINPKQLAYMMYTSGSTGNPKGVMISHDALTNRMNLTPSLYTLDSRDIVIQKTPFSFDISVWELFYPHMVGAQLVLARPGGHRDSAYLVELLVASRATTVHFVPSMMRLFLEEDGLERIRHLKRGISGGEPLPLAVAKRWHERFPNVPLWNLYGPTEATLEVAQWCYDAHPQRTRISIGKPMTNCQLYVLDTQLNPVPLGLPGKLYIGGIQLARGYNHRAALSASKFIPHPHAQTEGERLYDTGDLARFSASGDIEFLGRCDFQVKIRGLRIELGEIEVRLGSHEAVREVCILDQDFGDGDVRLIAYIVTNQEVASSDLKTFLQEHLPLYMVPSAFVVVPHMPVLANGKIDRKSLAKKAPMPRTQHQPSNTTQAPRRTHLQKLVLEVWQDVLGLTDIGLEDNFFDLGGHSLNLLKLRRKLARRSGQEIELPDLFNHTNIAAQAKLLSGIAEQDTLQTRSGHKGLGDIAIISAAVRVPGADDLETFWQNLQEGVSSLTRFSREELLSAGLEPELIDHPDYVPISGVVSQSDRFDAAFFGYNPREAEMMDPQHRIFLETAYEALERAGYASDQEQSVGVFAGSAISTYLLYNLITAGRRNKIRDGLHTLIQNDKDFIATRTSYKLNLKGPSISVGTACSTSLVAVHLACKSLLAGEADMALAGGISVRTPEKSGYLYEEGSILALDGICRAFDANASGTIGSDGVGVVLLKPLEQAQADGDPIMAIIKGSAINNDGSSKIGFTAPSESGQAQAIRQAQANAGISPEDITYVEAHGTGTLMGDPVEIAALKRAFRAGTDRNGFCALGSVKTNIGHTDAAAGVVGMIKTALMLQHRRLVPIVNFHEPNPKIDFENSPFLVNTQLRDWDTQNQPRRAGVSSFGLGGTNAHLIMEEAPLADPSETGDQTQLLLLSARSEKALSDMSQRLHDWLGEHPEAPLADVAFTLQKGRRTHSYRRAVLCQDHNQAREGLLTEMAHRVFCRKLADKDREVAFLFPGQGCQYPGMAAELYKTYEVFQTELDRCYHLLKPHMEGDLLNVLFGEDDTIHQPEWTQTAIFAVSYALAKLWEHWGIKPGAMYGHSLGEYVAATLAGVFSLEDALFLVAKRAQLMASTPEGRMLAVPLPPEALHDYLCDEVFLANHNAADLCLLSGTVQGITTASAQLAEQGIQTRELKIKLANHSPMMKSIVPTFREAFQHIQLNPAQRPYISNVTGDWIEANTPTDPEYWMRHLLEPVQGHRGLACLKDYVTLEVGPGTQLSNLLQRNPDGCDADVIASMRHPHQNQSDPHVLHSAMARLWLAGVRPNWHAYHGGGKRARLVLPTYPYERQRFWLDPVISGEHTHTDTTKSDEAEVVTAPSGDSENTYQRPQLAQAYEAPRTVPEKKLAELWADGLGFDRVGIRDNFFDLGGNSLIALRIVNKANTEGVPLTVVGMNAHQTIAEQVNLEEVAASFETDGSKETKFLEDLLPEAQVQELKQRATDSAIEDVLPLGPMQLTMVQHLQAQPNRPDFMQQFTCQLHGVLDVAKLQQAWAHTTTCHQALRTSFEISESPKALVWFRVKPQWQFLDWRSSHEDLDKETAWQEHIRAQMEHSLPLDKPPIELELVQLGDTAYGLSLRYHHLLMDPFASTMIWNHWWATYSAITAGETLPIPEAHGFRRYLTWLAARDRDFSARFWKETLADMGAPPQWQASPSKVKVGESSCQLYGQFQVQVDADTVSQIRSYIQPRRWTMPNILEPLWALMMGRLWDRSEVSFGLKFFGRPNSLPGMHQMVGPCSNLVPTRIKIDPTETLADLLLRYRDHANAIHDEEFYPLSQVRDWAGLDAERLPIISEVALERFRYEEPFKDITDVSLSNPHWFEVNPVPLKLCGASVDGGLMLTFFYHRSHFADATIQKMANTLCAMMNAFVEDPNQQVERFCDDHLSDT